MAFAASSSHTPTFASGGRGSVAIPSLWWCDVRLSGMRWPLSPMRVSRLSCGTGRGATPSLRGLGGAPALHRSNHPSTHPSIHTFLSMHECMHRHYVSVSLLSIMLWVAGGNCVPKRVIVKRIRCDRHRGEPTDDLTLPYHTIPYLTFPYLTLP